MKRQTVLTVLAVLIGSLGVFASYTPPPPISQVSVTAITTNSATINWKTSKASDSQVAYGTTSAYGNLTSLDPAQVTSHSQTLTDLVPNTTYHFQVRSTPAGGTLITAGDFVFSTLPIIVPGMISGVSVSGITSSSATISWTTNVLASSEVDYGPSTNYVFVKADSSLLTSHSLTLSGLAPAALYHYQVKSLDAAGNVGLSPDATFSTLPDGSPKIFSGISATAITASSATIVWNTSTLATSQVDYGTTINYGSSTGFDSNYVTSHSQLLGGLAPNTLYHFRVRATDTDAVTSVSADYTFTTASTTVTVTISSVSATQVASDSATIVWTTSPAADSQVEYGITTAYGNSTPRDPTLSTTHSQGVDGLVAGTLYHFRVRSAALSGDPAYSGDLTFTTTLPAAPVTISGVTASMVTGTSANITWTTSVVANSQVEYGGTASYGSLTTADPTMVTAHLQTLSGLVPNTLYHYRVKSTDGAGNLAISDDFTFTTAPSAGPVKISGVAASMVASTSATITWTTSVAANSQVEYGGTASYGNLTTADPTMVTAHSQTLSGLVPNTLYHYRVKSTDGVGDLAISDDFTFTTVQLSLFYPQIGLGKDEYTAIALSDLDNSAATVRFTAFDGTGAMVQGNSIANPVTKTLNAGAQMPIIDDQLFGPGISDILPLGWREIDSSTAKLAGLFLTFNSTLTLLDGAEISADLLSSLVLPETGDQDYTKLLLANPNSDSASVTIDLVKSDGTVRGTVQTNITGGSTYTADLRAGTFPGVAVDPSDYVRVSSTKGLLPYEFFGRISKDLAVLAGQDLGKGSSTLYSPQYVVGGAYRSTLSIVNLDSIAGTVTLRLMGDDGSQIGVTKVLSIARGGKIYISDQAFFQGSSTNSSSQLTQGYVRVTSDGIRLSGSVVFSATGQGTFTTALPLLSTLRQSVVLSQVASNDTYFTGVAILNPNIADATVEIDLYNSSGQMERSITQSIAAGQRTSRLLTEYFPALVGQDRRSGYIQISADKGIACFAVFGTNSLSVMSTIPAQPMP